MPQGLATKLTKNDQCKLQELVEVLRRENPNKHPQPTKGDALYAAVAETDATSLHDGVNVMHHMLIIEGRIKHSHCKTR